MSSPSASPTCRVITGPAAYCPTARMRRYAGAQPRRHLLGDREFVPLSVHLLQMLGQLLFESVQF
ncbi:hypothetical protein [Streptomyces mirabilis]|uniref:hypothetical protein n=1 Tax=Streptomyces mirabilis TaxID=68239 RepID=UPI0022503EC5|nr:hypothetical protein [Streptomyces mirabilis]MCX4418436.1 hypothetical protein [Streptomyces mirabilis]